MVEGHFNALSERWKYMGGPSERLCRISCLASQVLGYHSSTCWRSLMMTNRRGRNHTFVLVDKLEFKSSPRRLTTEECVTMLLMEDNLSILFIIYKIDWCPLFLVLVTSATVPLDPKLMKYATATIPPHTVEQLMKQVCNSNYSPLHGQTIDEAIPIIPRSL
jgi:hypothetical protein